MVFVGVTVVLSEGVFENDAPVDQVGDAVTLSVLVGETLDDAVRVKVALGDCERVPETLGVSGGVAVLVA